MISLVHKIPARKSSYHQGKNLHFLSVFSFALASVIWMSSDPSHCIYLNSPGLQDRQKYTCYLFVFVVLSASVTQERAHALRKMWRTEIRMSGQQIILIWRPRPLQRELQCLESLPIQLTVPYSRVSVSPMFVIHFPFRLK